MAAQTQSASDLIVGGLRNLNVLAAGEPLNANDGADSLQVLNDMLDSLSTEKLFVPSSVQFITAWNPGQFQYTIGNPLSFTTFAGTVTLNSNVITGVTIPSGLIIGSDLTDVSAAIPAGAAVTAIGANTVTFGPGLGLFTSGPENISFTTPGFFKTQRPLRFRPGFTRITASGNTGLDYWFDVISLDDYNMKGYKGVPGPWPYYLAYQTTEPLGNIFIYPNPQQAGEVHLWMDAILGNFTNLAQTFQLPQGYARAIKKLLAVELAPEYGIEPKMELKRQAREAKDMIRNLNSTPIRQLHYDSALQFPNRKDAGWIEDGGFNR